MIISNRLKHPESGKTGLTYDYFGKTDSRPLHINQALNRVFVGSPWENDNGTIEGKVHVYDLNGTFLTTLSSGDESFGITVFSLEKSKRLYVGSHLSDKVYVYDLDDNYALLHTMTADTTGEHYGWAISGVADFWCESDIITHTINRMFIGAPQGNVVYEYTDDGTTLIQKLGPNEDTGIWAWNYADHSGIDGTNYKTDLLEFGYSIDTNLYVKDILRSTSTYLNLIIGAPGSHNDHGATVGSYGYDQNVTGSQVYAWYFDTYYPDPADLSIENEDYIPVNLVPPYRTGEKVHNRGLYRQPGFGASNEHLATIHTNETYRLEYTGHIISNDYYNNYVMSYDTAGELEKASWSTFIYDALYRSTKGQRDEDAIFFTSYDDRAVWKYTFEHDSTSKLIRRTGTGYYSQAFLPKGLAYDPVNRLVMWTGSIYMFIHYDPPRDQYGNFPSLSARKTNWNIRPSGGGIPAYIAMHYSSQTAFLAWDRASQLIDTITYSNPYSPTLNNKLGGAGVNKPSHGLIYVDNTHDKLYVFGISADDPANDRGGLYVYDLTTTPTDPPLIDSVTDITTPALFPRLWAHDWEYLTIIMDETRSLLYVAAQGASADLVAIYPNVWIFDCSDPTDVSVVGTIDLSLNNKVRGIAVYGNNLYLTTWDPVGDSATDGLYTYDVSDPSTPVLLNTTLDWDVFDIYPDGHYSLTAMEHREIYYKDVVLSTTNFGDLILPKYPEYGFAKEIYEENDFHKKRFISSPEYGANSEGIIEYWHNAPDSYLGFGSDYDNHTDFQDPDGTEVNQNFGYSMNVSKSYLAANSTQSGEKDVVLMSHPNFNLFEVYGECDPKCGLIRIYDSNSNSVNLQQEIISEHGIGEFYDASFDPDDHMIVVHYRGKIQVRGKHRFYINEYSPPTPPANPTHKVNYTVYEDGVPVARKVSLFDKLTGEFIWFADSDPNNPSNNEILLEDGDLKFLIAFDPSEIMHPVGIDDILPTPIPGN